MWSGLPPSAPHTASSRGAAWSSKKPSHHSQVLRYNRTDGPRRTRPDTCGGVLPGLAGESTVRPIDTLRVCLLTAGERRGAADRRILAIGVPQAGAAGATGGIARSRASRLGTRATPQSWWQRWHSPGWPS
jgi:hypothetical protein